MDIENIFVHRMTPNTGASCARSASALPARHRVEPPRREQPCFGPRGDAEGDELFRGKRAEWYEKFTGRSIADTSLQEQNDLCDAIARRFRDYSDGRPEQPCDRRFRASVTT